jgi:zinc/manganese transport system ATP-binding protein/zinc transport system ATP-binding protein
MQPLVEFENVTCGYDHHPIFEGVTLNIAPGQLAGIVGPTGSGKTTLLKSILGVVEPMAGEVRVMGRPTHTQTPGRIGYVPQLETVDWNFPVTVEQVVMMGRYREMGWMPWPGRKDHQAVGELLDRLGMGAFLNRHIRELSGGQQQRVFLARALVSEPQLLLLDEPTAGVDIKTQHDILHILGELNQAGVTILLTTHDLNAVAAHLPWVICFNQGVIAQGKPEQVFTAETLQLTYRSEVVVVKHGEFILMAHQTPISLRENPKTARPLKNKAP